MMRRAFDSDSDYAINSFITDSPSTIQAVATRLRLFLGEWFLNIEDGIPWYQGIFVKPARVSATEKIIRDSIAQTEGVEAIQTFESNFDSTTRKLSIQFSATTIYGDEFSQDDLVGVNL